jgi:uncharacterized membrane protein YwaF
MNEFFSNEVGSSIEWFGTTHILIILGFIFLLLFIVFFGKKLSNKKTLEIVLRIFLIALVFVFEWNVFENRLLNTSIIRLPLCAVALYGLTYSVALKKEKAFKMFYFYWFGTIFTFLFFDTPFGLDRWSGWTYFGAHAMIGILAIYGLRVFKFIPTKIDLWVSMNVLAVYAMLSGYATFTYGGSDELFLKNPPVDFLNVLKDTSQILYTTVWVLFAALIMVIMYLPFVSKKSRL